MRDAFTAKCNESEVILMERADIGRMKAGGRCIPGQAYIGCKDNILTSLDRVCSGRQECRAEVSELEKLSQSCSTDYKVYLEAEYSCITGE